MTSLFFLGGEIMQIRMKVSMAFSDGAVYRTNQIVEVSELIGTAWVQADIAELVTEPLQEQEPQSEQPAPPKAAKKGGKNK